MLQVVSLLLSLGLLAATLAAQRRWKRTTLRAPLLWAAGALLLLAAASGWSPRNASNPLVWQAVRFAVGVSTLCPIMAVLGAKRPQDRGWQWVVATMWLVTIWPAAQAVTLPAGPRLELFAAWQIFLWGLILLVPLNYLATRFGPAALCVAAGQVVLLAEQLGWPNTNENGLPVALGLFSIAASWVAWRADFSGLDPLTERWLRFRDCFGAFWALRILQRVNETAELRNWGLRLAWHGFTTHEAEPLERPPTDVADELRQSLDTLLRRFMENPEDQTQQSD